MVNQTLSCLLNMVSLSTICCVVQALNTKCYFLKTVYISQMICACKNLSYSLLNAILSKDIFKENILFVQNHCQGLFISVLY
jgi:ABC-type polysaccharide transport system permease subunit